MMNETIEKLEIDENLINFNGPEDDEDDFDDDDFNVEIDSIGGYDDFDDEDEDF
ncbi:hypothetical protein [Sphingobacterium bovistauri]|uniref:Uncharacterized protein n=1 Tax=Sphingobacterium bovistauri TaxID=2781959 RepID=A0ABS7Z6K0_9SPHI|nr:hypothetical protein [Sphingobacterium bovistauri]MCA5005780.1 hypothetical protein [Sphingobacterium bovistauri]